MDDVASIGVFHEVRLGERNAAALQAVLGIGAAAGQRSRMIGNEVANMWDLACAC
jgi:hypothetical protein